MSKIKVSILGSGSKGNCTLIETPHTKVLIDCGFSARETIKRLDELGVKPNEINGIFLTHEHRDHTMGLENFASKFELPVFAHQDTLQEYERAGLKKSLELNDIRMQDFYFRELTIAPFEVSHDARHCNGYSIYCEGEKFSLATDLGYINASIIEAMQGSETIVIESNHDTQMLRSSLKYPQVLKDRIAGRFGHLSNVDCANAIAELVKGGSTKFILAHLSQETNAPYIAQETTVKHLNNLGADTEHLQVVVASQDCVYTQKND